MIKSGHGDKEASLLCVPVHVSHRMETTVSIQSTDQGGRRVSDDQDGRDSEEIPGDRVRATKYPAGPYPSPAIISLPNEIELLPQRFPRILLYDLNHLRYAVFWREAHHQVDMVRLDIS